MIDCLIFSKDRALQLHGLLQTIHLAPYDTVGVLWTASSERFRKGYERVRWPLMAEQEHFELQVRRFVNGGTSDHIVFHTDDDLFFRRPPAPLPLIPGVVSLRLGLNTRECFMNGEGNRWPTSTAPAADIESGDWLYWDWRYATNDYGYPLSLNGHIFRRSDIADLLDMDVRFDNPSQLECALAERAPRIGHTLLAAPRESCVVSVPWNRVTTGTNNPVSDDPGLTAEALNERWLDDGCCLDPFAMDFSQVRSPHSLLVPVFKPIGWQQ